MTAGYSGSDVVQVGGWVGEWGAAAGRSCLPALSLALPFVCQPCPALRACPLQENLRQLCVFKMANDSGKPYLWWVLGMLSLLSLLCIWWERSGHPQHTHAQ